MRNLRTNKFETGFQHEKQFVMCKLRGRGHIFNDLGSIADKYAWARTDEHRSSQVKADRHRKRIVPFNVICSACMKQQCLGEIVKRNSFKLPRELSAAHRVVTCFLSGRNLFRLRYVRFT